METAQVARMNLYRVADGGTELSHAGGGQAARTGRLDVRRLLRQSWGGRRAPRVRVRVRRRVCVVDRLHVVRPYQDWADPDRSSLKI